LSIHAAAFIFVLPACFKTQKEKVQNPNQMALEICERKEKENSPSSLSAWWPSQPAPTAQLPQPQEPSSFFSPPRTPS
jgi:hypothetical protein